MNYFPLISHTQHNMFTHSNYNQSYIAPNFNSILTTAISRWKYQFSSDHWSQATLSLVSTWMGDRLGTPSAVVILFLRQPISPILILTFSPGGSCQESIQPFVLLCDGTSWHDIKKGIFNSSSRQRPYHVENTSSRPITEVKQRWAWLVLGWETAWEHQVLLSFLFLYSWHLL